jgi:hypothetical protein
MIAQAKRALVEQLLEEDKLTQREISAQTEVSRGTVASIAAGTYAPYRNPNGKKRQFGTPYAPRTKTEPRMRCPGCGATVFVRTGCLACKVRRELA